MKKGRGFEKRPKGLNTRHILVRTLFQTKTLLRISFGRIFFIELLNSSNLLIYIGGFGKRKGYCSKKNKA